MNTDNFPPPECDLQEAIRRKQLQFQAIKLGICPVCGSDLVKDTKRPRYNRFIDITKCSANTKHYYNIYRYHNSNGR